MLAGLRLNLNRPLGVMLAPSGTTTAGTWQTTGFPQYSTASGTVDLASYGFTYDPTGQTPPFNNINPNSPWPVQIQARQLLARYLYVLAMVLHDSGTSVLPATLETGSQNPLDTRRLAQWAINAVCFETNDSIMVPFKYDPYILVTAAGGPQPNPGWQLTDDIINTNLTYGAVTADSVASFGVVWGCKPPELLLMETAAFHDRGVADTAVGPIVSTTAQTRESFSGSGTVPSPYISLDQDVDQVRVPKGSLLLKLLCPRSPLNQAAPSDLYTYNAAADPQTGKPYGWSLNLGQLAPSSTAGGALNGAPVWRIVVSQSRFKDVPSGVDSKNDVSWRLSTYPDSSAIEPEQYVSDPYAEFSMLAYQTPVQSSGTAANVGMERVIWFTPTKPTGADSITNTPSGSCSFWNNNGVNNLPALITNNPLLPGGHYLVLGPRANNYIGTSGTISVGTGLNNANQCLSLSTTASPMNYVQTSGSPFFPTPGTGANQIKTTYSMVIAATTSFAWPPGPVGISISEPLYSGTNYYNVASAQPTVAGTDGVTEWYGTSSGSTGFLNTPLESTTSWACRYRRRGDWESAPCRRKQHGGESVADGHEAELQERFLAAAGQSVPTLEPDNQPLSDHRLDAGRPDDVQRHRFQREQRDARLETHFSHGGQPAEADGFTGRHHLGGLRGLLALGPGRSGTVTD